MTETFSLLVYVLVLYWSLAYLRDRRLWQLAVVQALSVLLIGFRMSFLPVVQACTILLPLIAFARCGLPALRKRSEARAPEAGALTTGLMHVIASITMMFVMHDAYKYANGWLSKREPAYLHDSGTHLAAVWAPALEPSDATDSRFRDLIANGDQFKIDDLTLRNAQHFGEGFLIDRWRKIEKHRRKRDRIARETAMNALRRRPLQIAGLALKTYTGYWGIASIQSYAREDLGGGELTDEQVKMLVEKFRFTTVKLLPAQPFSLLQQVLSWRLAVLLHRSRFAFDLCIGDVGKQTASIYVSPVYSCFNPAGGDNSSVTASERSISSTRFYVDPFEHRRLH